jgi:uncharacterized protein DUF262/uncharacterized protein DUF1524
MSLPFAAQTMTLGQLLQSPYIVQTPPYQRSFAWEEQEGGQLLEDLVSALDADKDGDDPDVYFLGAMLFIEAGRQTKRIAALPFSRQPRQTRVIEVVDGLQRLTTLTTLLCVIRDFDDGEGLKPNERLLAAIGEDKGARPRLTLRDPDEAFFNAHVRRLGSTRESAPGDELSPAAERILEVRDHLRQAMQDFDSDQRRRLVHFVLDRCPIVMVVTTGIDRAHRMFKVLNARGKPLARNDILKADLLGDVLPAARGRATAIWDQAERQLGDDFESLFSHIRTIHGRSSPQVIAAIRSIAQEAGGGLPFTERVIRPAAEAFADIAKARHTGSPQSAAISASLTYLGWLKGSTDWVPPALLWWMNKGRDASELAWLLRKLDRLAYGMRILGHGAKRRIGRFNAVVHAIRNDRNLKEAGSPIELAPQELRTIHHNLRDLHARSAPIAKLVLLRLNDHMAGRPQGLDPKEMTVEHVLPRKPSANSQWRGWFRDPAERDKFTECIGNLVLTTKHQNDRAGNLDFDRKKDVLFATAGAPVMAVNDYVRGQSEWKVAQIVEREAALMRHLDQLWQIGPGQSRNEPQAPPNAQPRRRTA